MPHAHPALDMVAERTMHHTPAPRFRSGTRRSPLAWFCPALAPVTVQGLKTALPPGIMFACMPRQEDTRDVLVLGPRCCDAVDVPLGALPPHAVIGSRLRANSPRDIFA